MAALAYGTQTIAPVAKIVGPGNAYVAAAKRRVFGTVGIDMIAGPSEVLVIADRTANPAWIAADMLAQAEHDSAAQAILITDEPALADDEETLHQRARLVTYVAFAGMRHAWSCWADHGGVEPLADRLRSSFAELQALGGQLR